MPKRGAVALGLTTLALVLLLNFQTPGTIATQEELARSGSSTGSSVAGAAPTTSPSGGTSSGGTTAGGTAANGTTSSSGSTTATGPEVDTRYGPVQVSVTVVNGQVTDVTALELPSGGRSGQISREAEPILHDEALSAQSASIDGVSGATYTSLAYEQSLQAALDAAGLHA